MQGIPPIEPFQKRLKELDELMAAPDFFQDQRKAAVSSREHQKLSSLVAMYEELVRTTEDREESQQLIADPESDPDLRTLAEEELPSLEEKEQALRETILVEMIPPEETDSRNTVMEIRAGTGGDEASLFAGDLYRMYSRYAESCGWRVEPINSSPSECGGFKEISFLVTGEDVYKQLKLESGVHRVQRIPVTEAGGRIHTSAATVAVLPEAEEVDIDISPEDLEISVCRASGPGGQGVNTTDSAVQIVHKPTGMIVTCADERSQQKNKVKAMKVLRSRLLKAKEEEERAKYAANRRTQIGSGDRSERIRTYNFPQGRLTDHRIGLTLYSLPNIMEGKLEELLETLHREDQKIKVEAMLEDKESDN
mgnify:CR=1 FL=1|tara:strand:+ start:27077 stop:28174 length:1098 start_codon:yes stop_codon:yes gene_type:complete